MTALSAARARSRFSESQRRRLTLLAMCVATFMIQLDVTIVNVALPSIQRSLHTTPGDLEWVISAYALALAALIPVGGALGDRYGRKRLFLIGVTIFTLGSIACALSGSDQALIGFRVVQGVGGAAMLALALSIITETFPTEIRASAIGTWAAIGGTGFGVGPVVGGILLSFFGWASVFWVNIPFAVVAIALTLTAVAESRNPAARRLDLPGVAASALGLVGITLGLVEASSHPWTATPVLGPLVIGAVFLACFALWERRTAHPMIPPTLLAARSFVSAAGVYLISYAAFGAFMYYLTLLYQDVNGWSPLRTGLSWLFMNVPFLLMAQLTGRIDRRHPPARVVGAGCVVAAIGIFALSRADPTSPVRPDRGRLPPRRSRFRCHRPRRHPRRHARRARRRVRGRLRDRQRLPPARHLRRARRARQHRCHRRYLALAHRHRPLPRHHPSRRSRPNAERRRSTHQRRHPRTRPRLPETPPSNRSSTATTSPSASAPPASSPPPSPPCSDSGRVAEQPHCRKHRVN